MYLKIGASTGDTEEALASDTQCDISIIDNKLEDIESNADQDNAFSIAIDKASQSGAILERDADLIQYTQGCKDWPEPKPLTGEEISQPYPLHALPAIIREAVEEIIDFVQCPMSIAASSALGVLSAASQGLANVCRAEGLSGPISLNLLSLADSGERKTTTDNLLSKPIKDWEQRKNIEAMNSIREFESAILIWNAKAVIGVLQSLVPLVSTLTQAEVLSIIKQMGLNVVGNSNSRSAALINEFIAAAKSPNKDIFIEDIAKKIESGIDKTADNEELTNDVVGEACINAACENILPEFNAAEILLNIDKACELVDDDDTIDFLIVNAVKKLWAHFMTNDGVENTLNSFKGGKYSEIVKETFTNEYNNVVSLNIPEGYAFTKGDGKIIQPNMMQKLVASKIRDERFLGNWSGVGAGKTLSAIVASRVIKAKLTVIVTLNATLEGWKNEILSAYPDSYIFDRNNYHDMKDSVYNKFLLLNYEKFQQRDSEALVRDLVQNHTIDFIVLDEIQSAKQRGSTATMRRNLIENMISNTRAINSELHVLGISATPVINNLNEAVSLLQMIVGDKFEYLNTSPTIYNCLDIHKKLILHGVRYVPKYDIGIERVDIEVNGIHLLDELKVLKKTDILKIERILINDKLHAVKNELTPGTIIYTHYVAGIVPLIKNFLRLQNLTYAECTGENKDDLKKFINGDVDILIGSSTIGTGLDGLQKVCNKLIILNLPWTHAAYIQLLGRIYRQGSIYDKIKVIIPQVFVEHEGDIWSYDKYRIDKIGFKKTLGDAVLDGVFPEEMLSSPSVMFAEAIEALNSWIQRLERNKEQLLQPA